MVKLLDKNLLPKLQIHLIKGKESSAKKFHIIVILFLISKITFPNKIMCDCLFYSISRPLELFLKQMEHARSTCSNAKKSFVNRMMVDFDKTDLDEDGTIQACDYAQKIVMRFNDNAPQFRILLMILENYDCRISRNEFQHLVHQCYIDFTR